MGREPFVHARCPPRTMETATLRIMDEPQAIPDPDWPARWRREARSLILLGGPVIGTQLAQISMHFVDTLMAGWLGPKSLAAISIGGCLWMPIVIFGMGILMAVSPTVAHCFGAGQNEEIGGHVHQGLWLSLIVAIWSLILVHSCHPILDFMGVEPEIIPTAVGYLRAVAWGLPASCAFIVLKGFSEAVSMTRPLLFISLTGVVANIVGNYAFMYGHFGMPRLGAVGTGVSTAIVMWVELICAILWIVYFPYYRPFAVFRKFELPDWREAFKLFRLGAPIGVSLFMEGGLFSAVALMLGRMGANAVSGHQIAINVASVTFMVPLGIAVAITVRVGQALGRGDPRGARRSAAVGATLAVSFMTLTALAMAVLPRQIAAIYTDDANVTEIAVSLLAMAAIFQIFDGLQVAGAGALRGLKDTTAPMFITAFSYWGLGVPIGYYLGITRGLGPQGVWMGPIGGLLFAAVLLNIRFYRVMSRRIRQADAEQGPRGVEWTQVHPAHEVGEMTPRG